MKTFNVKLRALASVIMEKRVAAQNEEQAAMTAREHARLCDDSDWEIHMVDTSDIDVVDVSEE